ncbi:glycosyltransferase [Pseudoxanthomonas beigongshangi]
MRFLLIAYEFPPSPSPQSLRWAYLTRELVARGHQVKVLTIHLGGQTPGLPELPSALETHRTFAGPLRGLLAYLRDRKHAQQPPVGNTSVAAASPLRPPRSWKQSFSETAQNLAARFVFPDVRGEWSPWARPALARCLKEFAPDIVISSHEPATSLELGLLAKAKGYRWIADLGDPVLAPYTPPRWRDRALRVELETWRKADHLIVTHAGAERLLKDRHGPGTRTSVISQGFSPEALPALTDIPFDPRRLELLYTGSFYQFRKPDDLVAAIAAHPGARLNIASVTVPESLLRAAETMPEQIRLLGFLPHRHILQLQRSADVLINIANDDPSQVPGKLYEYLGSGRPILHVTRQHDTSSDLIATLRRGWVNDGSLPSLQRWFDQASALKKRGELDQGFDLGPDIVSRYSWPALAARLEEISEQVVRVPAR